MDINDRIRQFETMVAPGADPDNDMAWFSLAGAYAQAARHADAAAAYSKCFELNPNMSKAYQLAGKSFIDAGNAAKAAEVLTRGYTVATHRGDQMPRKAIADLLTQLGRPIPVVEPKAAPKPIADDGPIPPGSFVDRKTNRPGTKMPRPPFKSPLGRWIQENISQETWNAWLAQGTKVINEMRLDLSREDHAATYDQQMCEYLGVDEELLASLK